MFSGERLISRATLGEGELTLVHFEKGHECFFGSLSPSQTWSIRTKCEFVAVNNMTFYKFTLSLKYLGQPFFFFF